MMLTDEARAVRDEIVVARGTETQQAFATRLGLGLATLQRWEAGKTVPTDIQHVDALEREGVNRETMMAAARARVAS